MRYTIIAAALLAVGAPAASQTALQSASVLKVVGQRIVSEHPGKRIAIVGVAAVCHAEDPGAVCDEDRFTPTGDAREARVAEAASLLAAGLGLRVAPDLNAERNRVAAPMPAIGSPVKCADAGAYVLSIYPSVVRETKPGTEWRVAVLTHVTSARSECVGTATLSDYLVVSNGAGVLRVGDVQILKQGTAATR